MTKYKRTRPIDTPGGPVEEPEDRFNWTAAQAVKVEPAAVALRCTWHTRLIIPADRTPSGTRYEFMPNEVQAVDPKDRRYLLGLEKTQAPGCCGGVANPPPIKYFVEV